MDNFKDIFLIIFNMSITATYVAVAIMVIRYTFLKKLPKIFSYSFWVILLFRLISPISFSSHFSFFNALKSRERAGIMEYFPQNIEMIKDPIVDVGVNKMNNVINATLPQATQVESMNLMELMISIATALWIMGIIGLIIYSIKTYVKVTSRVRTATLLKDQGVIEAMNKIGFRRKTKVYVTDQIVSPFVCGFIIPKVYLPINTSEKELSYILTHELVHVKRFDYIIKPFSYLILIIHWFNPILWFSFRLMSKDMEMSCDEKVMKNLGDGIKEDYSNSLLSLAIKENRLLYGSPLAFGESNVKSRIKNVLKFKKPSFYLVVMTIVLMGMIGFILLSNPIGKKEDAVNGLDYKKIYEHKTLYVGDASKVSGLASNLYYSEFKEGIALKTDGKPYGVTVNYSQIPKDLSKEDTSSISDKMLKNAAIMFCLIDNVDEINFVFHDNGVVNTFPFEREFIDEILGEDIRHYSTSFNKFNNEFIPMIEVGNSNLRKRDMTRITDVIGIKEERSSTDVFGKEANRQNNNENGIKVEELLQIIMSSPKTSSNPYDYIKAHQNEYETILKMGHDALDYMLSLFEKGENSGLKAHIMMALCIDLLGDRNNVEQDSYTQPKEWYSKLSPYEAIKLPPFQYQSKNNIEELVYSAALLQSNQDNNDQSVTIVAPKIFGTYEKEKELRIFVTVHYRRFILYEKTLHSDGGGVVPAAIVYTKNKDGSYSQKDYIVAKDGSYFKKSIEEFCEPRDDIAKAILNHYGDYGDLFELMKDNLIYYLKENNLKGIMLKENNGGLIPLT